MAPTFGHVRFTPQRFDPEALNVRSVPGRHLSAHAPNQLIRNTRNHRFNLVFPEYECVSFWTTAFQYRWPSSLVRDRPPHGILGGRQGRVDRNVAPGASAAGYCSGVKPDAFTAGAQRAESSFWIAAISAADVPVGCRPKARSRCLISGLRTAAAMSLL